MRYAIFRGVYAQEGRSFGLESLCSFLGGTSYIMYIILRTRTRTRHPVQQTVTDLFRFRFHMYMYAHAFHRHRTSPFFLKPLPLLLSFISVSFISVRRLLSFILPYRAEDEENMSPPALARIFGRYKYQYQISCLYFTFTCVYPACISRPYPWYNWYWYWYSAGIIPVSTYTYIYIYIYTCIQISDL